MEREARMKQRFEDKSSHTSFRYLRKMRELSGAPEEMAPFFDTLDRIYTKMKNMNIPGDVPLIGTYCVQRQLHSVFHRRRQGAQRCMPAGKSCGRLSEYRHDAGLQ